jgi:hypothetical protein
MAAKTVICSGHINLRITAAGSSHVRPFRDHRRSNKTIWLSSISYRYRPPESHGMEYNINIKPASRFDIKHAYHD